MPSKIRVLDDHTINQIKAGEVIESASSVVKELVENAIDAKASKISIEIRGGGRNFIKIVDNGCGMSFDDAILAFERHATSKISQHDDLFSLSTMGFRGEALPSIASISKFTLCTKEKNGKGTLVSVEGGKMLEATPFECAEGTSMEIKSLFFNVPVRKNFQKSLVSETLDIQKVVQKMALANPLVEFEFIADGKKLFYSPLRDLPLQEAFKERIKDTFPEIDEKDLLPLFFEKNNFLFFGFLGTPSLHKATRVMQHLFINERAVTSPFVSYTIKASFSTLLPENRFPLFFLHMKLPSKLIDVNVHPQKKEIRLREESLIKEALFKATALALQGKEEIKEIAPLNNLNPEKYEYTLKEEPFQRTFTSPYSPPYFIPSFGEEIECLEEPSPSLYLPIAESFENVFSLSWQKEGYIGTIPGFILLNGNSNYPENFLFSKKEGVLFFNHKLCYERILFEKILEKKEILEVEPLLFPFSFKVTGEQERALLEKLSYFKEKGLEIILIAPLEFSLHTLPSYLKKSSFESIKEAVLDYLDLEVDNQKDPNKEETKWAASMAQKLSPSKNILLHKEEAISLLQSLFQCKTPHYAPLGKPTFYLLESESLLKNFQKGIKELCI